MTQLSDLRPGDLLSIPQVQKLVPVGRSTIYKWVEDGALPCIRVGATRRRRGRVLVHRYDLRAFLEKSRQARVVAPTRVDVDGILEELRGGRKRRA